MNENTYQGFLRDIPFGEASELVWSYRHTMEDIEKHVIPSEECYMLQKYFIKRDNRKHLVIDIGLNASRHTRMCLDSSTEVVNVFFQSDVDAIRAYFEEIGTITRERDILETMQNLVARPWYDDSKHNVFGIPTLLGKRVMGTLPFMEIKLNDYIDFTIPVIVRMFVSTYRHHFDEDPLITDDSEELGMPWIIVADENSLDLPPFIYRFL